MAEQNKEQPEYKSLFVDGKLTGKPLSEYNRPHPEGEKFTSAEEYCEELSKARDITAEDLGTRVY